MVDSSNYLDAADVVYELFGDFMLFTIIGIGIILVLSIKFKLGAKPTSLLMLLFASTVMGVAYNVLVWVYVVLIAGGLFYFFISKVFGRG